MRTVLVARVVPGALSLNAAETHHLLRVIRLERGGLVRVADGAGREATGTLVEVREGLAWLDVGEVCVTPAAPPVIVLLGQPKPALVEEAVTLGTELGATAFWLVRVEHSPPGDAREERLARVLDAALKQCRRADRPELRAFASLHDALAALPAGSRFLATPGGAPPHDACAAANPGGVTGAPPRPTIVAIGPEGGFTPDEVDEFVTVGFVAIGLGSSILRAPTAVAAALVATAR